MANNEKPLIKLALGEMAQGVGAMSDAVFKDAKGNSISLREVKKYDRGHKISKHNKGTNQLDNLVPELLGDNRSHQEENLEM